VDGRRLELIVSVHSDGCTDTLATCKHDRQTLQLDFTANPAHVCSLGGHETL
jgi:hypothetical protein